MNIVLWVIAGVLAVAFAGAGLIKLTKPKADIVASGMGWAESMPDGLVKVIGALEVLGAIGLILPGLLYVATVLVPISVLGLALLMVGAMVTHPRRKEYPMIGANLVLAALAVFVAVQRFGRTPSELTDGRLPRAPGGAGRHPVTPSPAGGSDPERQPTAMRRAQPP